jgi:hypothetical protein
MSELVSYYFTQEKHISNDDILGVHHNSTAVTGQREKIY